MAGFLGIIGGSAIVTGGAAVTTTGVLAPAGAVALVGGAAVATAGVAVVASATANITAGDPNIQFSTAQGSSGSTSPKGVGGKGWRGDKTWRENVKKVGEGGTIQDLNGQIPTQEEAIDLINEAGGTVNRVEGPHNTPNPHNFNHINYTTAGGGKGTIRVQ